MLSAASYPSHILKRFPAHTFTGLIGTRCTSCVLETSETEEVFHQIMMQYRGFRLLTSTIKWKSPRFSSTLEFHRGPFYVRESILSDMNELLSKYSLHVYNKVTDIEYTSSNPHLSPDSLDSLQMYQDPQRAQMVYDVWHDVKNALESAEN